MHFKNIQVFTYCFDDEDEDEDGGAQAITETPWVLLHHRRI